MRTFLALLTAAGALAVAAPHEASAQAGQAVYFASRAYPTVSRWLQMPAAPMTMHRFYSGAQQVFPPRRYRSYRPPPQYRMRTTTPYMIRRY